jgi:hypothetical protein
MRSHDRAAGGRTRLDPFLWAGIILPPASWLLHGFATLLLGATICTGWAPVFHVVTLVLAAGAAMGGGFAYSSWRAVGGGYDIRDAEAWLGRVRFLSLGGMALSMIFSLVIATQWVSVLVLSPCRGS